MRAVGKYIAIKQVKEINTKTKGGLILSESQREDVRYRKAEVIVVGESVNALKSGDNIYYDKAAGFNIEVDKEEYKIIKEQDVVIIL
tara:strand:+ start:48 stop:308 length:261 start_codon:yes stop_codon:yes gene_type:complete